MAAEREAGEKKGGNVRVVIAALAVNVAIAACKFVAAVLSGSTAMLAEAFHSTADTANQIFLLVGMRKAARPPDRNHPFGHGPETYFWAFMVALCIFALGGYVSVAEGVSKIVHRHDVGQTALHDPRSAYVILGISILLESYSFSVAMKEFRHIRAGRGIRRTLQEARDPTVLTVMFEDLAALFGLVVAFIGIWLTHRTGDSVYDGAASIVVGVALGSVAFVLGRDTKSLLVGRSMNEREENIVRKIVGEHRDVSELVHLRTMHMGPHEVIAAIKVRFDGRLDVRRLETTINEIEAELRSALPQLRRIYIEPGFDEEAVRAARRVPPGRN
ncbi:MAG TPA: cation diffusion facilitator family transporter [Polyangia bacterium]|nr:cation diffusion facilitator family transporter [Polyangia bacterium]HWE28718.1 cation diffusion facilitator family transporter [Polyangia bacterium]